MTLKASPEEFTNQLKKAVDARKRLVAGQRLAAELPALEAEDTETEDETIEDLPESGGFRD